MPSLRQVILLLCGCAISLCRVAQATPAVHETELIGGLAVTAGNSDTLALSAGASTNHKTGPNEFNANGEYKYGESTVKDDTGREVDDVTTDNAKADSQYNRLLWPRTYEYVRASALYDVIAEIEYRVIAGPGLGQYLIKSEITQLGVEAGISYLAEHVGDDQERDALLRAAQRYEHQFQEGAKVWQNVEYMPTFGDFGTFLLNSEIGTESTLTRNFRLRVVLQDRYDDEPAEDSEANDLSLTAAVVCRL